MKRPYIKKERSEFRLIADKLFWVRLKIKHRRDKVAKLREDIKKLQLAEEALLIARAEIMALNSRKGRVPVRKKVE